MTYSVSSNNTFNEISLLLSSVVTPYYIVFDDLRNKIINFQSNYQTINSNEYQTFITKLNQIEEELPNYDHEFSELNSLIRSQLYVMKDILNIIQTENLPSSSIQNLNSLIMSLNTTQQQIQPLIIEYVEARELRYEVLDEGQINIFSY